MLPSRRALGRIPAAAALAVGVLGVTPAALASPPSHGRNLIRNGSFEHSTARWGGWHSTIRSVRIPSAPGGTHVLHVAFTGGRPSYTVDDVGRLVGATRAGATYLASAQVRAASPGAVGKPIALKVREYSGRRLVRHWIARTTLTAAFQPLQLLVRPSAPGRRLDIRLSQGRARAGDAFLADVVSLVRGRPRAVARRRGTPVRRPKPAPAPVAPPTPAPVVAPAPAPVAAPIGGLTSFRGDWETGDISQWSGTSCVAADRLQIVTNPVRQGRYAARFEVRPGDKPSSSGERCEVLRSPHGDESAGQAYYYAWSTMVPVGWQNPKGFGLFLQFHTPWPTNPALELSTQFGELYLFTRGGDINNRDARRTTILPSLSPGLWNDFIMYVKWGVTDGAVKIWHRVQGQSQFSVVFDQTNVPDVMTQNGVPGKNYLRWGYYRGDGSPGTAVVYQDGMRRGPTYADVAADFPPS